MDDPLEQQPGDGGKGGGHRGKYGCPSGNYRSCHRFGWEPTYIPYRTRKNIMSRSLICIMGWSVGLFDFQKFHKI